MPNTLTALQIKDMQHAIGYSSKRVRGRKYLRYAAYRNRFAANSHLPHWDDLCKRGFAECRCADSPYVWYHVTAQGLAALGTTLGVTITEDD